jgi:FlgD Ig-like domain
LRRVLTTVTLLGLLVATAAAFAITEHLKLIKSPVYAPQVSKYLSPICRCATDRATVSIKLRHRAAVTVAIVDAHKKTVATLAYRELKPRGRAHWTWDGNTDAGQMAPDGIYLPEVALPHRTFLLVADPIRLDTKAPKVLSASSAKAVLLAGPGRSVAIRYVFNEQAHPVVYLGRHRVVLGRRTRPEGRVKWAGTVAGRPLPAGRYVLSVGALDVSGNETPAAARKQVTVVVRYIELRPARITVRGGARFSVRVETVAPRWTWRLGHRHGSRSGKLLRLRAPTTRGIYRLVVAEGGHVTTVLVRVRAR